MKFDSNTPTKVYRHPLYWYELESITRFLDVHYVDTEQEADYVEVASSANMPVFEGITKPIIYSYVREHPYPHDDYLVTQFQSLKSNNIKIFSLGSFNYFAPNAENIIIDQFELDAYYRLFIINECKLVEPEMFANKYLFLGGKPDKMNRRQLYNMLEDREILDKGICTLFGMNNSPDSASIENNHYLGYPYNSDLYKDTRFSLISETHFEHNQEFHPTEKTYRAIANKHPFVIASTPGFLEKLKQKGYKTFDHILDERYDQETDHETRLEMLVDTFEAAIELPYEEFIDICNHNYNQLVKNAQETLCKIGRSL